MAQNSNTAADDLHQQMMTSPGGAGSAGTLGVGVGAGTLGVAAAHMQNVALWQGALMRARYVKITLNSLENKPKIYFNWKQHF